MIAATLLVVVAGVWAFRQLKLEAYPDISDPGVVVVSAYPGFAAEEVEQQVTVSIERALNNTPHVIARRSRTIFGLSVVELTFADGTDDYFARQLVLERLRDANLPDGVTPTLGPLSPGIGEMYRYTLEGKGYDAMRLREIQDWVLTPRLLQVPGVADVVTFGGQVRQYQIEIDPRALDKYRLSSRCRSVAPASSGRSTTSSRSCSMRRKACRSSCATSAGFGSARSRRPESSPSTTSPRGSAGWKASC